MLHLNFASNLLEGQVADNLTDVVENELLDALVGNAAYSVSTPIKLALVTSNGNDASPGVEATGGGYTRQTITFGAATGGSLSNNSTIQFGNMPTTTVVGIELYDNAGKRVAYGPLTASKSLTSGDTLQFAAASVALTLG